LEAFHFSRSLHNLQRERVVQAKFINQLERLSCITASCPYEPEAQELVADKAQLNLGPITILDVSRMYHHRDRQTQSIYKQMSLSPVNFFAAVISIQPPFSIVFTD
jgi:hypothetical protein